MYVVTVADAYQVLLEVISKLSFARFPLAIAIRPIYGAPTSEHANPTVTINMQVKDRMTGAPREIGVVVAVTVRWQGLSRMELDRAYAKMLYQSVRQAVLHEIAECTEYEGCLFDDPHDGHPHSLRPEHDPRFPNFRNGY